MNNSCRCRPLTRLGKRVTNRYGGGIAAAANAYSNNVVVASGQSSFFCKLLFVSISFDDRCDSHTRPCLFLTAPYRIIFFRTPFYDAIPISATRTAPSSGGQSQLPDSIKRVGTASKFPNEYPGQDYAFNWCLNGDGVTPLKKSAFRITKPLDLQVAGLQAPKKSPLKVHCARCPLLFQYFLRVVLDPSFLFPLIYFITFFCIFELPNWTRSGCRFYCSLCSLWYLFFSRDY